MLKGVFCLQQFCTACILDCDLRIVLITTIATCTEKRAWYLWSMRQDARGFSLRAISKSELLKGSFYARRFSHSLPCNRYSSPSFLTFADPRNHAVLWCDYVLRVVLLQYRMKNSWGTASTLIVGCGSLRFRLFATYVGIMRVLRIVHNCGPSRHFFIDKTSLFQTQR